MNAPGLLDWALGDGYWRVRVGRLTVFDWSLAEALGRAARVKGYARRGREAGEDVLHDLLGYFVMLEIARLRQARAVGAAAE